MRKLLLALVALAVLPAATCNPDKAFVESMDKTREYIEPEYPAYVQADPKLTPAQKELRAKIVAEWAKNIKEYKERVK